MFGHFWPEKGHFGPPGAHDWGMPMSKTASNQLRICLRIMHVSPSLRLGKVFCLSTRKLFFLKLSWVKGFSVTIPSSKWIVQYIWNVYGLALWKAFDSCRHDLAGSPGLSAAAHRHQVSLGLSFKQVGLWFIYPLRFGSTPPLSKLCRLNVYYSVTQHSPLCTNCFRWDSWYLLSWSFMIFYDVHLCLLVQILEWNIQDFNLLLLFTMRGLVRHLGGN